MDNLPRASSTSNINKNHANQKSSTKDGDVRSNNDDHVKNPINSKSMNMLPSINHKRASTSASAGSGLSEHFHSKHAADRNGVLTAPTKQMHNDGNNGNHSMSHTGLHADNHSPHTLTHAEMHHAAFGGNEAFVNTKELHNRESRSHIQWQDDIARHIITMYATTKVTKPNISKEKREATQHLLSFVDVRKKNEGLGDVNTDIYMDNTNIPSPDAKKQKRKSKLKQSEDDSPQFSSSNLFPVQESEVESKSGKSVDKLRKSIELGHRNVSIENSKRKKKKKKRVNNKISDVSFELDKYDVTNMNQKDGTEFPSSIPSKSKAKKKVSKLDDEVAPELIDALPAQLKNLPESFSKTSKFRTCYVVKNKEGVETIIRGSPKCYPIWFVASGEVNANWEALPNGEAIQAHLSSIYEKGQYEEYIGIVERIVLDLRQGILDRIQHQPLQLGEHGRSCAVSKANLRQLKSVKKGSPAKKDHYGIPLFYMESANTIMKSCDIDPGKNTDISFNRSNSPSQRRSRIRMLNQSNAADGNGHMFGYNSSHSDQNQNGSDMEEQPAPYDYADQILQNSITTTSGEVLNINGLDVTAVQSQHSGYQSPNKLHTPSSNGIRRRKRNESGDELMNSTCNSPNRSSLGSRAGTRVGSGIESPFMNDMPALSPIRGNGTASNTNLSMNFNMSRIASCGDVGTEEFSNERSADTIPPMEGDLQMIHVQFYWKQLIATAIAMSILSTNKKDFVCALRLLQKAMSMCKIEGFLEDRKKIEMEGYVYSAMAYYFFKCGKKTAALAHTKQAGKLHAKIRNYDSVAISLLHVSVIEIQQSRFKEAHKV